jgi:CDP-6-deoxy-D-xylo-4-hexulose-3-dehydrase
VEILAHFAKNGIETRPIVAGNFTLNPVMQHLKHAPLNEMPNAELLHDEGFFIGNHHTNFETQINRVFDVFVEFTEGVE